MKFRTDFVTNSSSSSFIFYACFSQELTEYLIKLIRDGYIYSMKGGDYTLDPQTLKGYLVNKETSVWKGRPPMTDLMFMPYFKEPETKIGFQISLEYTSKHKTDFASALLSFINLKKADTQKKEEILSNIHQLIQKQVDLDMILCEEAAGTTNDVNYHFNEHDYERTLYTLTKNARTILGCKNPELIIAEKYWPCDRIADSAFENMKELQRVKLNIGPILPGGFCVGPDLAVGKRAFADCEKLADFPFIAVSKVESSAFANCRSLKTVQFSSKLKNLGTGAFEGCAALDTVVLNGELKAIKKDTFKNCTELKDVYISLENIETIAPTAFEGCSNVTIHTNKQYVIEYAKKHGIPVSNVL